MRQFTVYDNEQKKIGRVAKEGEGRKVTNLQYYMDGYLRNNLDLIPKFLNKGWDCVIIVSGHSKVRIGKSTLASQIGYYLSWLLSRNKKIPTTDFDNTHIAFTADELMEKAEKFPPNSVLIYDEAMTGLNSSRAMESINKTMVDFFTECGHLRHVIIIVLPSYFKLMEDMAVSRSLFLVDCYTDEKYQRGRFAFYNENRKELLYAIGRRRYGTYNKYNAVNPNFRGRFTKFMPGIDVDLYEYQKKNARKKKKLMKRQVGWIKQRNAAFYMMNKELNVSEKEIAERISILSGVEIEPRGISHALLSLNK